MKLSAHIYSELSLEQIIDVIAQLLEHICAGGRVKSAAGFEIEPESGSSVFGTLKVTDPDAEYEGKLHPIRETNPKEDDVFTVGLLLYIMLAHEDPNMKMAEQYLFDIDEKMKNAVPMLSFTGSSLNELLEKMTDVNWKTRISAEKALDLLANHHRSDALIHFLEKNTGAELARLTVSLNAGYSKWMPPTVFEFNGRKFFPTDTGAVMLPYRVSKKDYFFSVGTEQTAEKKRLGIKAREGTVCFGLDLGADLSKISCLDSEGNLFEPECGISLPIPSVMAFRSQNDRVYGREAEELCRDGGAELIRCFGHTGDIDEQMYFRAAGGTAVQASYRSVMEGFAEHLFGLMREDMGYESGKNSVVLSIPAGSGLRQRSALLETVRKSFPEIIEIPDTMAAALSFASSGAGAGNIMVFDAGKSSVHIGTASLSSAVRQDRLCVPEKVQGINAPGGDAVTDRICDSILGTLKREYDLNMYDRDRSGLSLIQYSENRSTICSAAERIKMELSFSEKAECEIRLHRDNMNSIRVLLSYTDSQYTNMLRGLMTEIKRSMKQCLSIANMIKADIDHLIIAGGTLAAKEFIEEAREFFTGTSCRISIIYDHVLLSRGAAIYAALVQGKSDSSQTMPETVGDLGTMTANLINGMPVFHCLIPDRTPLENGSAAGEYIFEIAENDIGENGCCDLKLYSRERGMSHVESSLDPDGWAIKYIGSVKVTMPENYNIQTDRLEFSVGIDAEGNISASAVHTSIPSLKMRLKGYEIKNGHAVVGRDIKVQFCPAKK